MIKGQISHYKLDGNGLLVISRRIKKLRIAKKRKQKNKYLSQGLHSIQEGQMVSQEKQPETFLVFFTNSQKSSTPVANVLLLLSSSLHMPFPFHSPL